VPVTVPSVGSKGKTVSNAVSVGTRPHRVELFGAPTVRWFPLPRRRSSDWRRCTPVGGVHRVVVAALRRRPLLESWQIFCRLVGLPRRLAPARGWRRPVRQRDYDTIQERNLFYLEPILPDLTSGLAGGHSSCPSRSRVPLLFGVARPGVRSRRLLWAPTKLRMRSVLCTSWREVDQRGNVAARKSPSSLVLAALVGGLLFADSHRRLRLVDPAVRYLYSVPRGPRTPGGGTDHQTRRLSTIRAVQAPQSDGSTARSGRKPRVPPSDRARGLELVSLWDNDYSNRSRRAPSKLQGHLTRLPQQTITIDPRTRSPGSETAVSLASAQYVLKDKSRMVAGAVLLRGQGSRDGSLTASRNGQ